ncbi:MAG: zinc-binding dehydrogenase [Candidatus Melainabacteria bacterium]|nr:zinc-binding dehydrogenase [Candidatus Melainabacteria bacterium]
MKAMVVHEHGPASVMKPTDFAKPKPGIKQALVKVRGCALNHLDVWIRTGIPGVTLPIILGCDVAGEVVELGEGVSHLAVGNRVLVDPGLSCTVCKECLSGNENLCRDYHILGAGADGGYAEYVAVPAENCFAIPPGLSFCEAAAIPLVFMTAWHMLVARAQVKLNETVLVVGGGSGVGTAAIQIAKLYRCRVIATVGSQDKASKVLELGADEVIIHTEESIADAVRRLTDKRGVDIVFEHVGPAVFGDCLASLAINGRLVTCGATTGPACEVVLTRLFMKHQTIYGSLMGTKRELVELLSFFRNGLLKPVVDTVLPLAHAVKAHEMLESRLHFGKIVLDPTI